MKNFVLGIMLLLVMLVWFICRWPIEFIAVIICIVESVRGDDDTPIADRLMNGYDGLVGKITNWAQKYAD